MVNKYCYMVNGSLRTFSKCLDQPLMKTVLISRCNFFLIHQNKNKQQTIKSKFSSQALCNCVKTFLDIIRTFIKRWEYFAEEGVYDVMIQTEYQLA